MSFKPEYTITNKILKAVSAAESSKLIIENAPLVPAWERTFQTNALIRSVHHSTAIEGNKLDLTETASVVSGEDVETFRARDIREIINYRDVIGFISGIKQKMITMSLITDIHKILGFKLLPENELGEFRTKRAVIVNSRTGEVVFDATEPDLIEEEITNLIEWDKSEALEVHPLLKAGIIHYEFVRIHPFVDLNGRSARTLATWSLYRDAYDINRFFALEEHYDQNLKLYYDAIDSANNGDMTEWLEYFVDGVAEELGRVRDKVLDLSKDRRLFGKIGQVALNARQIEILKFIEEHNAMSNPDFVRLFPKVSDDTILRDLKDLMEKGIIKKTGKTKGAKYQLQ